MTWQIWGCRIAAVAGITLGAFRGLSFIKHGWQEGLHVSAAVQIMMLAVFVGLFVWTLCPSFKRFLQTRQDPAQHRRLANRFRRAGGPSKDHARHQPSGLFNLNNYLPFHVLGRLWRKWLSRHHTICFNKKIGLLPIA
jgi:hypothetical protein